MDVIELGRLKEGNDDDLEDHYDPLGYDEVLQVLQNFIWSHVDVQEVAAKSMGGAGGLAALLDDELRDHNGDMDDTKNSNAANPENIGEEEGELTNRIFPKNV